MHDHEVEKAIAYIGAAWPTAKPLEKGTTLVWGMELRRHDFGAVMRVLTELARSNEWRPSLAVIVKPLLPTPGKSAAAAFESVLGQIGKRPRVVTELEARAVKRLGGWDAIGQWQLAERHWQAKRFAEVYEGLEEERAAQQHRALASGEQLAIGGGPCSSK